MMSTFLITLWKVTRECLLVIFLLFLLFIWMLFLRDYFGFKHIDLGFLPVILVIIAVAMTPCYLRYFAATQRWYYFVTYVLLGGIPSIHFLARTMVMFLPFTFEREYRIFVLILADILSGFILYLIVFFKLTAIRQRIIRLLTSQH